ncbi:Lrp/AsnC family transcriptional regulator [Lichenihabitans sp. Uapishka_5]|uniref:Lrp/AsnC family transcriptional regulator n=1 Tax=Lichenihabitans sp. Uapishka_5 TaxID=3037302 RepID=UPI0029E82719|nr:Lrp/AsnC family transcriptional regulator [Lichenihabitans sp. Uapishka_5]MDX7952856.1 Lrp/AsnC family transcriptional regulator [Lichenihabitans sp. Uapishka_5]
MPRLDPIDRTLLRLLRQDGRSSNMKLAAAVGLSQSACLRRVRLLEEAGVIRGYTAVVSAGEAGGLVAMVQITLERQTEEFLDRFEAAILRYPEIRQCLLMTGGADYLLRVEAADAGAYEVIHREVLARLPGVARIQSAFAIRTVL